MMKTNLSLTAAQISAFQNPRKIITIVFALAFALLLTTSANAQTSFAGNYSGEWIAKYTGMSIGEEEHEGTWKISIASHGEVTGVEFDKTGGEKGDMTDFIDEDGYIKVFVKYDFGKVTIRGVLEKKDTRLTGTLKQACSSGTGTCANIEIILKRQ